MLAGRINSTKGAKATGEVLVNGQKRNYNDFRKLAAYVLQDDNMFAELTVEEQLTYAALLRLPPSMSREKKLMRVNRVIQELGLSKVRNTMVGNDLVRGISGGERKRVNIGTELVTDPALLFLDEPTTGLDSFNALNVMSTLRHLASNGRTVVSTIHQPRSSIFALFDQLCLLSEGRVMYFGPAKEAIDYFSRLNFKSPSNFNPADFFLDLLSIDPRSPEREASTKARVNFLGDKHVEKEIIPEPLMVTHGHGGMGTAGSTSQQHDIETGDAHAEKAQQQEGLLHPLDSNDVHADLKDRDYQSNWINEFVVLCNRAFKLAVRERAANGARFGQVVFFSIILGLIWLRKGDEDQRTVTLPGILFFVIINQAFGGSFAVIFGFPLEKSVVIRERAANMYRTSSYYVSKMVTDMPKTLFFNLIFCVILYWMVGLRTDAGAFFIFVLTIFLISTLAESLALTVSVMAGDAQAAAALIPVFVIIALLFGGFFLEDEELSDWIGWIKYTSFIFYGFNALVKNEFADLSDEEHPNFFDRYNNLSITGNLALVFACLVFYRVLGYLFLQYLRGPKFLKF